MDKDKEKELRRRHRHLLFKYARRNRPTVHSVGKSYKRKRKFEYEAEDDWVD